MSESERARRHYAFLVALQILSASGASLAQSNPGAAIYAQAGWDALTAGNVGAAADAFSRALATDPKNAELHLGASIAAFAERRDDDARAAAERALELDPTLWRAREVLGRVQYRLGDLDAAIRTFERLVADVPERPDPLETLARWRREADLRDRMHLDVGSRFTVAFDGAADAVIAAAAVASLDAASARIGDVLGAYPVAPIPVVLYSAAAFRDITRAPDWAGGAFDGIIRIPVRGALANPAEFNRVLAHEFTHALVHALAPRNVPSWLNEGLAVALQHESPPPVDEVSLVPLHTLARPFGRLSRADAERAYATSGLAVQRLLDLAGGYAVANLLRDVGQGVAFEEAFAHRVQRSLADFEASLRAP